MRFTYDNIRPARHVEGTPSPVPTFSGPPPRPRREERPRKPMPGYDDLDPKQRRERVLNALRSSAMTPARLIEAVRATNPTRVYSELNWLKRNDQIHQTEDGVYHYGHAPDPVAQDQQAEDTAAQLGAIGEPKGEDPGPGETTEPHGAAPRPVELRTFYRRVRADQVDRMAVTSDGCAMVWADGDPEPLELDADTTLALFRLLNINRELLEVTRAQ